MEKTSEPRKGRKRFLAMALKPIFCRPLCGLDILIYFHPPGLRPGLLIYRTLSRARRSCLQTSRADSCLRSVANKSRDAGSW
jgi:hypothetical protein